MNDRQQEETKEEAERLRKEKQKAEEQQKEKEPSDTLEDEDLDWEEGGHSLEKQSLSSKQQSDNSEKWHNDIESDSAQQEQRRQNYVNSMTKKFGNQISHEIRKCETRDLARRDIKKSENNDKLFDFMQIKKIKKEKYINDKKSVQLVDQNSS